MYYINKIVGFLVSPIGGAIAGGVIAVVCVRLGRKRMAKWIGGLTVAWLWLWMTPIMAWVVGVPLESEFLVDGRVPAVESFPEADAIVLLGGSMGIETNTSSYAEMANSADRVWQAARLYKAGKAGEIIATGDYAKDTTLPLLKEFGVGEEAVSFLDARTTEEEAKGLREMLGRSGGVEELGVEEFGESDSPTHPIKHSSTARPKVLLVTSAWHMKRARLMFEKYAPDIEVVCAPADFENTFTAEKTPLFKMLLPDPNVFMLNSVAFHEWVGIVGYKVFR
ncbi:MAG: YdcF family protein [Kiritimatiellae bacterium]|nr:YdcF family protein [Kiritimatiellia bacterium]